MATTSGHPLGRLLPQRQGREPKNSLLRSNNRRKPACPRRGEIQRKLHAINAFGRFGCSFRQPTDP